MNARIPVSQICPTLCLQICSDPWYIGRILLTSRYKKQQQINQIINLFISTEFDHKTSLFPLIFIEIPVPKPCWWP